MQFYLGKKTNLNFSVIFIGRKVPDYFYRYDFAVSLQRRCALCDTKRVTNISLEERQKLARETFEMPPDVYIDQAAQLRNIQFYVTFFEVSVSVEFAQKLSFCILRQF